jgi:hypothetical protein
MMVSVTMALAIRVLVPYPEGGVVPDVSGLGHNTVATMGR